MGGLRNDLRRPGANGTSNRLLRDVIGNKADTVAAGILTSTDSLVAYIKQLVEKAGIVVAISTVVSSGIPNNTQTAGAITGAASGGLILEDIVFQTDATGLAAPTNVEITTDNVNGKTGAGSPLVLEGIASFGANLTVSKKDTTNLLPMYLETGKKLYIHGDDAAGTGAGECTIVMIFRAATVGATIVGADIAAP